MRTAIRIVSLVMAIACTVVVVVVGLGLAGLFGISNLFGSTTNDRSQPALLVSIQDISQFHAAVGNFQVVLDVEQDVKHVPDFIAGERSLFVAAGTVNAYVDFSGLAEGDLVLSKDGTSVTIRLPDAELDSPNLDQERSYLYSQDRGVWNRLGDAISSQDQSDLYQLADDKLEAAAEESELAQQADDNTRAMLIGLFNSLDMKVTFTDDPPELSE